MVEKRELIASYSSPASGEKTFSAVLPSLSQSPSSKEKTDYLLSLRSNTVSLQQQVNDFLTQKMEEDKARGSQGERSKEEKEEEYYGEEADEV